ncbi:MAG TPA: protein-glutamate O-methyltransferase CheR [Longimicrobiales bacterium]
MRGAARSALPSLPLADGELEEADARELQALKQQVLVDSGLRCDGYKEKCLRRRIAVRMRARGVHRYRDYAELLRADPAEYQRLLATLVINVSKFFRNPEVWAALRERVVRDLLALDARPVRIWSAGTAGGEEAYSVAIMLLEALGGAVSARRFSRRFAILGTDIDEESLEIARRAEYGELALSDTDEELRRRWFEPGSRYQLRPEPRRLVEFRALDLMKDPFPQGQHLILCRNVIIYFERGVQEELFVRFRDALVPGGYLVLGKVETLFGPAAAAFRQVAARERIYQRI